MLARYLQKLGPLIVTTVVTLAVTLIATVKDLVSIKLPVVVTLCCLLPITPDEAVRYMSQTATHRCTGLELAC
jgi:hypothetical protein